MILFKARVVFPLFHGDVAGVFLFVPPINMLSTVVYLNMALSDKFNSLDEKNNKIFHVHMNFSRNKKKKFFLSLWIKLAGFFRPIA